jgi:hypothetical protein
MSDTKYISPKEFREKGYLQEVNRRFFHPLGLALSIKIDDNGDECFSGVVDCRDDAEGYYFDLNNGDSNRVKTFKERKYFIDSEFEKRKEVRKKIFKSDSEIEPII